MQCKLCGSTANDQVLTPEGPHYGKVVCQVCQRFLAWMPYPVKPINPDKLPKHPCGDPLPALVGVSPAQVAKGEFCRNYMLPRMEVVFSEALVAAARTITAATFWIASSHGAVQAVRWPRDWS